MNIFQELKEKKVLDKDGKVDALGPYGKMKLTGQEVAQYFKKNKVRDKDIKKAVEVALDLGGAMSVAQKEIKKFFGNKILKSKEVQHALKYANEEFQRKESESISEARAMKLKDIARKYKREIEQLAKKGRSPEMGKHKVYMALYNLAWENGDINTDDPDQTDEVIDDYMDDMMGEFFAHLEGFKSDAQRKAAFASGYKAKGKKDKKEEVIVNETVNYHTKISNINIADAMKDNRMLKKYVNVVPGNGTSDTYEIASLLMQKMKKFGFDKKEVKAIEDVMQTAFANNESVKEEVETLDEKSKDVRKRYRGKEQKSVNSLIMQNGVDKIQKLFDDEPKEFDALIGRLAKLESVQIEGETITEGKNLMPDIQKIVDTKGAAKVGGVMLDMFTASVITQAYEKVNDSNKKKMEKANIQTLVRLAQKMMGMKESEDKDGLDQNMKDRKNKKHVMDALEKKIDEWIAADGSRRRVHEKDKRKNKNVMDSYRTMWEDAIEEDTIVEKKELDPKLIQKIAKLTDRNDHNESLRLLAMAMRDKEAVKLLDSIKDMHKVYNHMPQELITLRNRIFDNLMRQSSSRYSNHKDVYGAL